MSRISTPSADGAPEQQDIDTLVKLIDRLRYAEAEALARGLIERFPADGFVWQALGTSLRAQGRIAEAVATQQQAIALSAGDAGAHYQLGESLMALRRPAAAAESYRRATAIKLDYFEAYFKLGNALAVQDRYDEAVDSYRRTVAIRPGFGEAHANLGFTLLIAGRYSEAEQPLRQALATHPGNAVVHNSLGVVLYGQERMGEAEASFRRAVALVPSYFEAYSNLGNALRDQQQFAEAESNYRKAIALKDDFARAHFDLGGLRMIEERFADAEQSYQRALQIKPDYVEACNNLGRSTRKQGRLEEARQYFETALGINPNFVEAYCNLAPLRTFTTADPELGRLESLAARLPGSSQGARLRYWFALGKMREDVGRHDDAFAAYAEGNRLQFAQFPPDEAREAAVIDRLQSVFDTAFFARREKPEPGGKVPIFIVGMPRSGTSLIEQILSTYPGIHGAGELVDMDEVVHSIAVQAGQPEDAYLELAAALPIDQLRRLGETYIERVWKLAPDAARITDKMMGNFLHVGLIHLMLPQAKIIHAMRDPMDSCFSCYSRLFAKNNLDYTYDLGSVGRHYVRYIRLMQHWHRVLPAGTVLDLHYEDMVADTEGQARRLLDYLGLSWDERCLEFHQNKRVVNTASAAQVRKPIYRSSVARWKHFEAHLAPLLEIVREWRPRAADHPAP